MRKLGAVFIVVLVASACGGNTEGTRRTTSVRQQSTSSPSTTASSCARGRAFIVVRHAEKASAEKDTPLSDRGRARAVLLSTMLANAGVTRLVATQYKRTQETLAPLAERLSLEIDLRPADAAASLVDELRAAPDGAVVVVATHSNVLPFIVRELGGARLRGVEGDTLAEEDYSRVVIITHACNATAPFVMELSSDGGNR